MALKVWLPLNGNLENKGCGDATITGSLTYVDGGKFGKARSAGKITISKDFMTKKGTMCFWINVGPETITAAGGQVYKSAQTKGRKWDLFLYSTKNSFHSWGCVKDESTNTPNGDFTLSNFFPNDTWVHVAVAHDEKKVYVYRNGELYHTKAWSSDGTFTFEGPVTFGETNEGILYNDLRIYDECLSPMQIKELAKGLISHYQLSCPGNPNLEKNTNCGITDWGRAIGGYYTSSIAEAEWLGVRACKLSLDAGDASNTGKYRVLAHKGSVFATVLKPDTQYTISFDTDRQVWSSASIELTNATHDLTTAQNTNPVVTVHNGYYHYKFIVTTRPANDDGWTYTDQSIYLTFKDITGTSVYIANLKLEEGVDDTTWVPHVDDSLYNAMGFNVNEPDCGTIQNNLSFTTTKPTWSGDSARYMGSLLFDGADSVAYATNCSYPLTFTVSLWFNPQTVKADTQYLISLNSNNTGSDGQQFAMFINNTGLSCHAGGKLITIQHTFKTNTWYHGVLTSDGTNFSFYLDGVLKGSGTAGTVLGTNLTLAGRSSAAAGANSGRTYLYHGLLNDVRIYSTVLSTADITDLYQKGAYVDNQGYVGAYEFIEGV